MAVQQQTNYEDLVNKSTPRRRHFDMSKLVHSVFNGNQLKYSIVNQSKYSNGNQSQSSEVNWNQSQSSKYNGNQSESSKFVTWSPITDVCHPLRSSSCSFLAEDGEIRGMSADDDIAGLEKTYVHCYSESCTSSINDPYFSVDTHVYIDSKSFSPGGAGSYSLPPVKYPPVYVPRGCGGGNNFNTSSGSETSGDYLTACDSLQFDLSSGEFGTSLGCVAVATKDAKHSSHAAGCKENNIPQWYLDHQRESALTLSSEGVEIVRRNAEEEVGTTCLFPDLFQDLIGNIGQKNKNKNRRRHSGMLGNVVFRRKKQQCGGVSSHSEPGHSLLNLSAPGLRGETTAPDFFHVSDPTIDESNNNLVSTYPPQKVPQSNASNQNKGANSDFHGQRDGTVSPMDTHNNTTRSSEKSDDAMRLLSSSGGGARSYGSASTAEECSETAEVSGNALIIVEEEGGVRRRVTWRRIEHGFVVESRIFDHEYGCFPYCTLL